MPTGQPVSAQPYDELLRKLKTWTNLRAAKDESVPSGYRLEVGPFPGWAELPEW